ncbi:P-loop containing nucleoside triphosphate hydrolase protein [Coprinopsis sp. MPI-PUGE-AT-0042]|nr:P-loop containing nucleoside triphosphate hydrolase protein [Coprinopsis sp. MPI-PUGE-AT-0042]
MGPTGVGKSSFIKKYTGNETIVVGHELKSSTRDVTWYQASVPSTLLAQEPELEPRRLILVDTPGFDDTFSDDSDILRRISAWLAQAYNEKSFISGIIYMNDISQKRMHGSMRMNLKMFTKLCGDDSFKKVVLATSQWDNLPSPEIGEQREKELCGEFWRPMLDEGARIMRFEEPKDPEAIIRHLIEALLANEKRKLKEEVLQIQKEVVDLEKSMPATQAGRELKYTIEELLRLQKAAQANPSDEESKRGLEAKRALLKTQAKALKLPFGERFKAFFGL